jgi:hypothetical protein
MQGTSPRSQALATGTVVSGVEDTRMMSTPSLISSWATSPARPASDSLSRSRISIEFPYSSAMAARTNESASPNGASGPVRGVT